MILKVHTRKTPLEEGVDLSIIARGTRDFRVRISRTW